MSLFSFASRWFASTACGAPDQPSSDQPIAQLAYAAICLKSQEARRAASDARSTDADLDRVWVEVQLQLANPSQTADRLVHIRQILLQDAATAEVYWTCENPLIVRLPPLEQIVRSFQVAIPQSNSSLGEIRAIIQLETAGTTSHLISSGLSSSVRMTDFLSPQY